MAKLNITDEEMVMIDRIGMHLLIRLRNNEFQSEAKLIDAILVQDIPTKLKLHLAFKLAICAMANDAIDFN